ncbi:MAG: hypothetical protein Q6373_019740 [Candidatus Sigynarchaeota archaeon]
MGLQRLKHRFGILYDGVLANTRLETRFLLAYLLALLVSHLVVSIFKFANGIIQIRYYMLDGYYTFGTASMPAYTVAEMIAFGPAMTVIMTWCFRKVLASWRSAGLMPAKKARVLELLFVVSVSLFNAGILVNRLFNVVSAQAKAFYEAMGFGYQNYVFAYFLDEIVGHLLMNSGLVLFYFVMAIAAPRDSIPLSRPEHALNGGERLLVLASSGVHAAIFSIENLEGQSMAFTLALTGSLACVLFLAMVARHNKISIMNRPFLMFLTTQLVVMLLFATMWGIALGVKPYYPYFYEPSELASP